MLKKIRTLAVYHEAFALITDVFDRILESVDKQNPVVSKEVVYQSIMERKDAFLEIKQDVEEYLFKDPLFENDREKLKRMALEIKEAPDATVDEKATAYFAAWHSVCFGQGSERMDKAKKVAVSINLCYNLAVLIS